MISIIKSDKETIDKFHNQGWGRENVTINKEQAEKFLNGDAIAIFDGEYTHVITIEEDEKKNI